MPVCTVPECTTPTWSTTHDTWGLVSGYDAYFDVRHSRCEHHARTLCVAGGCGSVNNISSDADDWHPRDALRCAQCSVYHTVR